MSFKRLSIFTHKTIAVLLAVWLSGVVFLLCCEKMNGQTADAEFCPLVKMTEHCDKSGQDNHSIDFAIRSEGQSFDCCGFLPAVFDKARKVERDQKDIAITLRPVPLKFIRTAAPNNSHTIAAFHTRTPNLQKAFINNCVFRI